MPKALIVGCSGQDGIYLSKVLQEKGYDVVGLGRRPPDFSVDISEPAAVLRLLEELKPEEIYYLAAFHHSAEDPEMDDLELIRNSFGVHTLSLNHFLYAITQKSPQSRYFESPLG